MPGVAERKETRLFSVDSVAGACSNGVLTLQVGATANSGGWGEPMLRRISLEKGTATYEVVALPPEGPAVTMMMQMFMLKHDEREPAGIRDVRVLATSNEMTAAVSGCPAAKGG